MGADMIVNLVAHKRETIPNFAAGKGFVRELEIDEDLLTALEEASVELDDPEAVGEGFFEADVRKMLTEKIVEFEESLDGRGVATLGVRDLIVYLTGGLSWGDDTEEGYLFSTMAAVPGLLEAMGFVTDWWVDPTEKHTLQGTACSCGWKVPLGKMTQREFDRHLLEARA